MMTEQEKQTFAWLTERLDQLATASTAPATQPLAVALIPKLDAEIRAAYPDVDNTLQKMKAAAKQRTSTTLATVGPVLWKTLHTRALAEVKDTARETRWLMGDFPSGLPANCECKAFYFRFLRENPPDFSDYFAWTVKLHNAVNRKPDLNKPEMTVEAARARWT